MSLLLLYTMKIFIKSSTYAMHHWLMAVYSTVFQGVMSPRLTRLDMFVHELMPICSIFSEPKAYASLFSFIYIVFYTTILFITSFKKKIQ